MIAMIFSNGIDIIMREGAVITRDISKDLEIISVIAVESVKGAKPQEASFILINAADRIIGKTFFNAKTSYFRCLGFERAEKKRDTIYNKSSAKYHMASKSVIGTINNERLK